VIIQRLALDDFDILGVRLPAEVGTDGRIHIWIRDESIATGHVAAGIILDREDEDALRGWLEKVRDR